MVRYITLISFTDNGIRDVSKSIQRAADFRSAVVAKGGKVLSQYWALGDIDGFVIFECPDDTTAAALILKLGRDDNVRTKTTRIFDSSEFETIATAAG